MRYTAALDIGGTKTIAAIVDEKGTVADREQFPSIVSDSSVHLKKSMEAMREVMQRSGFAVEDLEGLGVTLPGIVDRESGTLVYAPFAKWKNLHAADILREGLGFQNIACENDVNACAISEQVFGIGRKYSDFVWMTVSTGVGGAVVVGNELVRGGMGSAGEFGHLKVEYEHPHKCSCGQYGCMEAECSGTALNRMMSETYDSDPAFRKEIDENGLKLDGSGCAALAAKGNEQALAIFHTMGTYLGRGISYLANILNPQAAIIGGGVAASLEIMMPSILQAVKENTYGEMQNFAIVRTGIGYDAALLGAAALILSDVKK